MEHDTNHHAPRTGWRQSILTGLSMYRVGESLGTVWHERDRNTWSALVSIGIRQVTQDDFLSKKEAQMWCEEYIEQIQGEEDEGRA